MILFNGGFDDQHARAQAVAIAVGSNDNIRALAGAATKKIDLGGKTVVRDSSMHTRIPRFPGACSCAR